MEKNILNSKFTVNKKGEVFSKKRKLKLYVRKGFKEKKYLYTQLKIDGKQLKLKVDKLVFETFVRKINDDEILLKKENKLYKNNLENLYVMNLIEYLENEFCSKWKFILSNEYCISEDGLIYSVRNKLLLKTLMDRKGYEYISIRQKGKEKKYKVHRLIAQAFIPNPKNKPTVNHKDGIKLNNFRKNLEWATYSENTKHAFDNNLATPNRKKVIQYDLNKNFIAEFESITKASIVTKTNINSIIAVCKGKYKTGNGFLWEYGRCND